MNETLTNPTPATKICSKCRRVLPLSAFGSNKNHKDGLQYDCKECRNTRERNERNKRIVNAQANNASPALDAEKIARYKAMAPREIIAEIKERVAYLETLGYVLEGELYYTQRIKLH